MASRRLFVTQYRTCCIRLDVYAHTRYSPRLPFAAPALQTEPSAVFAAWAAHNEKAYTLEEFQLRLEVFSANVARQLERTGLTEGAVEVNGLADISTEEFKATHLGHVSRSTVTELGWGACQA